MAHLLLPAVAPPAGPLGASAGWRAPRHRCEKRGHKRCIFVSMVCVFVFYNYTDAETEDMYQQLWPQNNLCATSEHWWTQMTTRFKCSHFKDLDKTKMYSFSDLATVCASHGLKLHSSHRALHPLFAWQTQTAARFSVIPYTKWFQTNVFCPPHVLLKICQKDTGILITRQIVHTLPHVFKNHLNVT